MRERKSFLSVGVLVLSALMYCFGFAPVVEAANKISGIVAVPASPAGLPNGDHVTISFNYSTDEFGGARIFVLPYTDGSWSPNGGFSASGLHYGFGSSSKWFTILSGDTLVDQFKIYMTNANQSVVLWETFINVEYHFGNSITNINMFPASPAQLITGQDISITFNCVTEESAGAVVFARPYTNGLLTPGYGASGGFSFTGIDSGSQWFYFNTDNLRIDQIHFEMYNDDQSVLLLDFFVDVDYHISNNGSFILYVDADAPGTGTGHTWYNAFNNLQDALSVAWPGDEIWVAEGTYKPDVGGGQTASDRAASFGLIDGVAVYGGFNATESSLAERDWKINETILSGEIGAATATDNSYHVVIGTLADATAILDGFTISGGYNTGEPYPDYVGAGMLIMSGGEPTVSNCKFTNNTGGSGGGLGAWGTGSPSLFNCVFMANTASGGGGISLQHSSPVFRSCMILGNSASTGGGLWALNNLGTPILSNCVFSGNTAVNGGAINNTGVGITANGFPPELQNCSINENSASSDGGGIYNNNGNDVTLNSCILWGNTDTGGTDESAQFTDSSGAPSIAYSCLQGWTGSWGGAGNIATNPLFADPDGLDDILGNIDDNLRLQLASPCIDTGDPNPLLTDSDGSRNDMGAYGGPAGELGGIGVFPGSGFLFTSVGNIPRSEITQTTGDINAPVGLANGGPMTSYQNAAFGGSLHLHGLFGDIDTDVDYYQVLVGTWDGTTPPGSADWETLHDTLKKVHYTYNTITGEWENETITLGPQVIGSESDLYQHTGTGFWSYIDKRIIWDTTDYPDGLYTLTVKAYAEFSPGVLNDITPYLGNIGTIIVQVENSPVTATIHHVNYDSTNPYYVSASDGEISECSIINLSSDNENLRFFITASHPDGFLRKFTLDNIWGKNQYGGVIAQEVYSVPPAMWNGVTNVEYESNPLWLDPPPGSLQSWRRCAYQFRLRVWPRVTNGYGYLRHSSFSDHYFLDLPGSLDCSVYDADNDGFIGVVDFAAFASHWLQSCAVE